MEFEYTWALYYYVLSVLWSVTNALEFFTFVGFIFGIPMIVISYMMQWGNDEDDKQALFIARLIKKAGTTFVVLAIVFSVIIAFVPTRDDVKTMVALVGVETAVKSNTVKEKAAKSLAIVDKWLEKLEKE